ncbi:C-type mannose receptor 2 [Antennarius striatus]|uniref:C-type mannose receptor 2 n=1 Tax=Antennarius striatus TaxID=241820 RepID=UPI0035B14330
MDKGMFSILVFSGLFSCALHAKDHVYHFIQEAKTWSEAQQFCRKAYADLVSIDSIQDLKRLEQLVDVNNSMVFLGLHREWHWSLSDHIDFTQGEKPYLNWADGHPTNQQCAFMGLDGKMFSGDCNSRMRFSCNNVDPNSIEKYTYEENSKTWNEAQAYCRRMDTELAIVRNPLENNELIGRVTHVSPFWIGLKKMLWMWSDGSYPSFVHWDPAQSLPASLDCALLDVRKVCLGMEETDCNNAFPFLCYSVPKWKYTVRVKLSPNNSLLNMTDVDVRTSILEMVKERLKNNGNEPMSVDWVRVPEKEDNQPREIIEEGCLK